MTDYVGFFLNGGGDVMQLECIEISHPSFTDTFRYVKNDTDGLVAGGVFYQYQPMSIERNNVSNDLEQTIAVTIADMQDELSIAVREIRKSANPTTRPSVVYKIFRSDELSSPMLTLQTLEIVTISKNSEGLVTFEAQAPELNSVKTGLTYTLENYPLLRGI